jgi:hypothetical protein
MASVPPPINQAYCITAVIFLIITLRPLRGRGDMWANTKSHN